MIKKGILLAAGSGTRLAPLTKFTNKHFLNLYDKPVIFYSLATLMLAGIKDILIVTNNKDLETLQEFFGDGNKLGISISYGVQKMNTGIPTAIKVGETFIGKSPVCIILGDNFFYGAGLQQKLINFCKLKSGLKIILYPVVNPKEYGIANINTKNKITSIQEKAKKPKSNLAITGLYFFDNDLISFTKNLKKSKRKEFEITDILNQYLKNKKLSYELLGRGSTWFDVGTTEALSDAAEFINVTQHRNGYKIACLEEIAYQKGWINKSQLYNFVNVYQNSSYSKYIKKIK
jgi:glucose-1-phosphate thymidylyltransferase|tara:strand:+ start:304 stop:1170 length:867 start_codon:yes stop_codon:yes gene_type:complete